MTVRGFAVSGLKDRADKTRKAWAYAFANSTTRIRGRKTEDKNELTVWARFAFIEFQIIRTANDFRTVY